MTHSKVSLEYGVDASMQFRPVPTGSDRQQTGLLRARYCISLSRHQVEITTCHFLSNFFK
jgi:hypothetical protein